MWLTAKEMRQNPDWPARNNAFQMHEPPAVYDFI